MTNRSTLLLALLGANDRFGEPEIHRTSLVKQAYLAESIRPLYRMWRETFKFVRYYYGPYSEDIFYELDTLIFNGLVEVTKHERHGAKLEARYKITQAGRDLVDQTIPPEFRELGSDLVWALQALGVQNVSAICKLVYQEPEFAKIFASHLNTPVAADSKVRIPAVTEANNQTFLSLALLEKLQLNKRIADFVLPSRELVHIFLENLAQNVYAQRPNDE